MPSKIFDFVEKIIAIIISNGLGFLAFYLIYKTAVPFVPLLQEYYKLPLFIVIAYAIFKDIEFILTC